MVALERAEAAESEVRELKEYLYAAAEALEPLMEIKAEARVAEFEVVGNMLCRATYSGEWRKPMEKLRAVMEKKDETG